MTLVKKSVTDYEELVERIKQKHGLEFCPSAMSIYNYVKKPGERIIEAVQVGRWDSYPKVEKLLISGYYIDCVGGPLRISSYFTVAEVISENQYRVIGDLNEDLELVKRKPKVN